MTEQRTKNREQTAFKSVLLFFVPLFFVLASCAVPLGAGQGPAPTPTPLLAPYDAAVATAEAGGAPAARAAAYYERANVLLDQSQTAAAIADYDRALALDSNNARAFNNRALAHVALGQRDQALADYGAAIRLDPGYVRAYQNRARLLEQHGDLRGAAADYDHLATLDPSNRAGYRYGQGNALHALRDFAGARRAYDAALAADPQYVDALYERALVSMAQGQPAAAIADLDSALRLSPRAANAYYARGLAYSAGGNPTRAIADYASALALRSDYAEALLGRATAEHTAGDDARARADLDRLDKLQLDDALKAAADALRAQLPKSP